VKAWLQARFTFGYDGPSVTSELPQKLGKLFMRDRGRSASFVSRSSCPRAWAVRPVAAVGKFSVIYRHVGMWSDYAKSRDIH
jgi:hypothetical protein